jgi:hypothetical protein
LFDKTFRLFVNQKVPAIGVIGGKIQVVDHLKIGKTLHPTPYPQEKLFAANPNYLPT